MKLRKLNRLKIYSAAVILTLLLSALTEAYGQTAPPPPPPPNGGPTSGHGLSGNQGAPGAPVGNGVGLLIVLGILYAGNKSLRFVTENTGAECDNEENAL